MARSVFSGSVPHTMDAKGRVTIPVAYREALGDCFTIGLNNDMHTIALYPQERWQEIERDLEKIPPSDVKGMWYVRMINGNSFPDCQIDAQGRVLLPPVLRRLSGITKDVRFLGVGRYLEIWDAARYAKQEEDAMASIVGTIDYVNDRYFQP